MAILLKQLDVEDLLHEFKAQIRRCLDSGLSLFFLNSHEHIHMLPQLYHKTLSLAERFRIPFVRYSDAEWRGAKGLASLVRNSAFSVFNRFNGGLKPDGTPILLGVGESGQLSTEYLERAFRELPKGARAELMCHPGHFDPHEIQDVRLMQYHKWESELEVLKSDGFRTMVDRNGIRLARFRDQDPHRGLPASLP